MNWITKRKVLINSFLLDSLFLILIYYFSKVKFYIDFSLLKNLVIFFEWAVLSYIFDRYYDHVRYNYFHKFYFIGLNFIKTLIVSFIIILSLKVFNVLNFELGYLHLYNIYFVFYLSLVLSILNLFLNLIYFRNNFKKDSWLFVGSSNKFESFKNEVDQINSKFKIVLFSKKYLYQSFNFEYKGIIVDSFLKLDKKTYLLLSHLRNKGIKLFNLSNWCSSFLERYPIEFVDEEFLFQDLGISKSSMQPRIKRLGDIFISIILLLCSIPIIIICSLLIYLEDRGPIFYKQKRNGQYQKTFEVFKLRTMKVNAEANGPQWSITGDKRITKLGRVLRLTRIDELPQLISVLKGEMSLIGPRPERPEFDKKLNDKIPHYSLRYTIRPGLSGWAQVNYSYGASISDSIKKFSYDLYYLKHASILLDFLICIRTIRMVFNARGATPKNN